MTSNSPLPWTDNGEGIIVSADGDVATVDFKADSALIVQAVNNYATLREQRDELVARNKVAADMLTGLIDGAEDGNRSQDTTLSIAIGIITGDPYAVGSERKAINAALKKVENHDAA